MLNKRYSDFVKLRNALRRANKEAFDRTFPGKLDMAALGVVHAAETDRSRQARAGRGLRGGDHRHRRRWVRLAVGGAPKVIFMRPSCIFYS